MKDETKVFAYEPNMNSVLTFDFLFILAQHSTLIHNNSAIRNLLPLIECVTAIEINVQWI